MLTLPLQTEAWQRDILEKQFEIHRQIYNALLQKALIRYGQMAQTRAYRNIREALSRTDDERERKKLLKERDCLIEQPGQMKSLVGKTNRSSLSSETDVSCGRGLKFRSGKRRTVCTKSRSCSGKSVFVGSKRL